MAKVVLLLCLKLSIRIPRRSGLGDCVVRLDVCLHLERSLDLAGRPSFHLLGARVLSRKVVSLPFAEGGRHLLLVVGTPSLGVLLHFESHGKVVLFKLWLLVTPVPLQMHLSGWVAHALLILYLRLQQRSTYLSPILSVVQTLNDILDIFLATFVGDHEMILHLLICLRIVTRE